MQLRDFVTKPGGISGFISSGSCLTDKSFTAASLDGPLGFQEVEVPVCLEIGT